LDDTIWNYIYHKTTIGIWIYSEIMESQMRKKNSNKKKESSSWLG